MTLQLPADPRTNSNVFEPVLTVVISGVHAEAPWMNINVTRQRRSPCRSNAAELDSRVIPFRSDFGRPSAVPEQATEPTGEMIERREWVFICLP